MIVIRRTVEVKRGRVNEAAELWRALLERVQYPMHTVRITRCDIGRVNMLAIEHDYESLEEHKEFGDKYFPPPVKAVFMKKWVELATVRTKEIWTLMN